MALPKIYRIRNEKVKNFGGERKETPLDFSVISSSFGIIERRKITDAACSHTYYSILFTCSEIIFSAGITFVYSRFNRRFHDPARTKFIKRNLKSECLICYLPDGVFGCQSLSILTFFKSGASKTLMSKP